MPNGEEQLAGGLESLEIIIGGQIATSASITVLELDALIFRMRSTGMSNAAIREVLLTDLRDGGRIFGTFRNAIKNTTGQAVTMASSEAERFVFAENNIEQFQWVTAGNNVCPDCKERAGRVQQYSYWELAGLPRSGFSICGANCNCRIIPASYSGEKIKEVHRRQERKKELEKKYRK